jgi:hypothetical protein
MTAVFFYYILFVTASLVFSLLVFKFIEMIFSFITTLIERITK